ncbi:MAG TPA: hypothetical protein DEA22_05245 [Blastocatellia bacterium]|nr:hypothetical protein [Blastocatellia bacterium]
MKNNKSIYSAVIVTFILPIFISLVIIGFAPTGTAQDQLTFLGRSNQPKYLLGEPVVLEFEITNNGKDPVKVQQYGVETGGLKIFISSDRNGEYKEFFVGAWGRKRGRYITLDPGESHKFKEVTILWNGKPKDSGLNEQAARRLFAGKIITEYAFPEPGVYFVKALSDFGAEGSRFESEPIRIVIQEPEGENLEAWKQINGRKEIARLMQIGDFNVDDEYEKEQLSNEVELIFTQFPNSIYSNYLKQSLKKFKEAEAQRKKAYENMTRGQKP